jgi:hypothetical protein
LGYVEALLVVMDKTAVSHQPGKRAFDEPALRLDLKAVQALQATHDFYGKAVKSR